MMRVFHSVNEFATGAPTVVTIGTFDGVHIGHRRIIDRLRQESALGESTILTFFPHPRMVLQGPASVTLLNTIDERIALLGQAGINNLIVHPFDAAFANLDARTFAREILVGKLKVAKIIIGHDHRFGVNRTAGIDDLIAFGQDFGFDVEQIPPQEIDDVAVSSTKIRNALMDGNLARANSFLGYDYLLSGTVVSGNRLGRTIGFPTANLQIDASYKLVPAAGVYAVWSIIDGQRVNGMMNIGYRPTIGGKERSIETYFFDFSGDLYNRPLQIHLVERVRDEQSFGSVDALRLQLQQDEIWCRRVFSTI